MSTIRLLFLILCAAAAHAEFRAAAVKVDITPKSPQWLMGYGARQSTGVHDPIFHRIAALDDGSTQVFLIASDLCLFSPSVYDDVTADLKRQTGIEPRQVWWTVTHTHSAPEVGPPGMYDVLLKGRSEHQWNQDYLQFVKSTLISGIKDARSKLEPARISTGTGLAKVLWGSPVELFCEIAIRVRNESPFRYTFFLGYTNGWLGYLPTAEAFREGGYEPRTSPFTEKVEKDFGDGVVAFLQGMPRE